ncbi:MAG: hypothetical protein M3Y07_06540 [Acidobacteriota bacterium]|nr:hypothetical protein [Acidobacteriota bacterium]
MSKANEFEERNFGWPLRATGIQHPAPHLTCLPVRGKAALQPAIVVTAPFATPVLNGINLIARRSGPRTQLWILLYAQVTRADGQERINVRAGG